MTTVTELMKRRQIRKEFKKALQAEKESSTIVTIGRVSECVLAIEQEWGIKAFAIIDDDKLLEITAGPDWRKEYGDGKDGDD